MSARPCPGPVRVHGDPGPITTAPLCEDCRRRVERMLTELPEMVFALRRLTVRADTAGYAPTAGLAQRVTATGEEHSPLDLIADELEERIMNLVACWTEILRDRAKLNSGGWAMLSAHLDAWIALPAQLITVWVSPEEGWAWTEQTGAQAAVALLDLAQRARGRLGLTRPFDRLGLPCESCDQRSLVRPRPRHAGDPDADLAVCQHCGAVCTIAHYENRTR